MEFLKLLIQVSICVILLNVGCYTRLECDFKSCAFVVVATIISMILMDVYKTLK